MSKEIPYKIYLEESAKAVVQCPCRYEKQTGTDIKSRHIKTDNC